MIKGQIKQKADYPTVDSPKKQMKEFVLFAILIFTANKTKSLVRFLVESMARPNCFWFYLTFTCPLQIHEWNKLYENFEKPGWKNLALLVGMQFAWRSMSAGKWVRSNLEGNYFDRNHLHSTLNHSLRCLSQHWAELSWALLKATKIKVSLP